MDPVQKALWFVEHKLLDDLSLDAIARSCHVSPYHLTRGFAECMGIPLMRYVRGRRLTEAAKALAQGTGDILRLAIDHGYGSHEAFTRAFKDQFGLTPEQVRSRGHLQNLTLVEAIMLDSNQTTTVEPPRIETLKGARYAGLSERYDCQSPAGIPSQWQRFVAYLGRIPGQMGQTAYGICYNFDPEGFFEYMSAVEVSGMASLPEGIKTIDLPAQKYAVFVHRGHISGIRSTISSIWKQGIPQAGVKAIPAPSFERYGQDFNPQTGMGNVEIWVPIEP